MIFSAFTYRLLLIGLAPLAVACFISEGAVYFIGLAGIVDTIWCLLLVIDWYLTAKGQNISCNRCVPERLSIGRTNKVVVTVENLGRRDLKMTVRDDYPVELLADKSEFKFVLTAGAACELSYQLTPKSRGSYDFSAINIRYLSFLGLFWRQLEVKQKQTVKVFSDLQAIKELSVRLTKSEDAGDISRKRIGQGTEFAFLRNYTSGDDMGAIDWKSTARKRFPQVRVNEQSKEQNLLILIDGGRSMMSYLGDLRRFDHALNAACGLASAALKKGDQVGLGVFADQILLNLPARRGKAQLKQIAESVFNLNAKACEPDYQQALAYFSFHLKGRSLVVVLTDLTDMLSSESLLSGLSKLAPRHLPLCVTFNDPHLQTIANQKTTNVEAAYAKAVALEVTSEREVALSRLLRAGCLVLDAPPEKLTSKLVDKYLDVKSRGLL